MLYSKALDMSYTMSLEVLRDASARGLQNEICSCLAGTAIRKSDTGCWVLGADKTKTHGVKAANQSNQLLLDKSLFYCLCCTTSINLSLKYVSSIH